MIHICHLALAPPGGRCGRRVCYTSKTVAGNRAATDDQRDRRADTSEEEVGAVLENLTSEAKEIRNSARGVRLERVVFGARTVIVFRRSYSCGSLNANQ